MFMNENKSISFDTIILFFSVFYYVFCFYRLKRFVFVEIGRNIW